MLPMQARRRLHLLLHHFQGGQPRSLRGQSQFLRWQLQVKLGFHLAPVLDLLLVAGHTKTSGLDRRRQDFGRATYDDPPCLVSKFYRTSQS